MFKTVINSFKFANNTCVRDTLKQFVEANSNISITPAQAHSVQQADIICNTVNDKHLQTETIKRLSQKLIVELFA